ncbi:MAG: D-alanine--D-alanine ligase [Oscillospiraceae bacterium]|jgi:D-alanine-D-alanine ligase|nr:D-alanine--D-alanine ligase [Oscillospiraceae bacterium]
MLNVCVVFGGTSSEHEVSLRSATSVLENMDKNKYNIMMLGITKSGRWLCYTGPVDMIVSGAWQNSAYTRPAIISPDRHQRGLYLYASEGGMPTSDQLRRRIITGASPFEEARLLPVDVVFPVLHGKFGEDGTIQGLFELAGIPYVGSDVLSSAACMDKAFTQAVLEHAGIKKTKMIALRYYDVIHMDETRRRLELELGYPMFVKPANAGSSVGVTKVKGPEELEDAFKCAFRHDRKIVVEQMVKGQEVECAVMGNDDPIASDVVGEIAPTHEFYDYEGKYLDDSTELYIPAHIPHETARKVRETAVKAYAAMGCRGLARVDFFVKENGDVVLNEVNTLPGFTSISMYAKLFIASGVSYAEVVDRLIAYALEPKSVAVED